ncbi:protein of unknown function [Shewanella benthica]|uniref:Uncharacterized protein n=1 Tax=Shewanella benthica TaxID=43661 RepID=A0A330M8Z6_9GAMM|nr:protein of unknown function [Shewanella benthica]
MFSSPTFLSKFLSMGIISPNIALPVVHSYSESKKVYIMLHPRHNYAILP